jgi:putative hydrolase of HD superfamily
MADIISAYANISRLKQVAVSGVSVASRAYDTAMLVCMAGDIFPAPMDLETALAMALLHPIGRAHGANGLLEAHAPLRHTYRAQSSDAACFAKGAADTVDRLQETLRKGDNPLQHAPDEGKPIIDAYCQLDQLKREPRGGWVRMGIEPCESVADHSYALATLTYIIGKAWFPGIDAHKATRIALCHDVGEAHTGDITPHDSIPEKEKHAMEREAVHAIFFNLPRGARYIARWEEYHAGQTPEARLVKELDKLEMALQATTYERQGRHGNLVEFLDHARRRIALPQLQDALALLYAMRKPIMKAAGQDV